MFATEILGCGWGCLFAFADSSLLFGALSFLIQSFAAVDTDNSGAVSGEELLTVFSEIPGLEDFANEEAVEHLMFRLDANGDGVIDEQEFLPLAYFLLNEVARQMAEGAPWMDQEDDEDDADEDE